MTRQQTVLLIMGSIRAGRIGPRITAWIAQVGRNCTGFACEIIDLADWKLPMDDEPSIPAMGTYRQAHTLAWSEKITSADAVVFVTPQYNWGYTAVLKNAIDHLYKEWHDKPSAIITYGGHGGGKCSAQLQQVAAAIKLKLVPTSPGIQLPEAVIREGASFEPERDFAQHLSTIQTAFGELAALMRGV